MGRAWQAGIRPPGQAVRRENIVVYFDLATVLEHPTGAAVTTVTAEQSVDALVEQDVEQHGGVRPGGGTGLPVEAHAGPVGGTSFSRAPRAVRVGSVSLTRCYPETATGSAG